MINETNQLAAALQEAQISAAAWDRRYGPIAKIKPKAPCLRILLNDAQVVGIDSVPAENERNIRRFGNNQGSFPAMNLAPLYRVADAEVQQVIAALIDHHGENLSLEAVRSWCIEDNWTPKFLKKYRQNFEAEPQKLAELLSEEQSFEPALSLIRTAEPFADPEMLRRELERQAFAMLKAKLDIVASLQLLFYLPTQKELEAKESGKLSVVLDSTSLTKSGFSTIGPKFAKGLNNALAEAERNSLSAAKAGRQDAFGLAYEPIDEPMPKVKLAAGFDATLRTMFHGQPCQYRYGKIEGGSYPLSKEKRTELSAALDWLSQKEQEDKTWVRIGVNEAMFIYPSRLPKKARSFTGMFQRNLSQGGEADFVAKAKDFAEYLTKTKTLDPDRYPEWIQFFALKKLDKARTKVVYSHNSGPDEIVRCSDQWQSAAQNLPRFHFGAPHVPFPLRIVGTLNRAWKRDGTHISDKLKESASFHGMDLFFGASAQEYLKDLRTLVKNTEALAVYAGPRLNSSREQIILPLRELQSALVLMGMLLFWTDHRKDDYMNKYPYLLGQMLKAADSLHELYCFKERKGEYPPQLVGGGMYLSVSEHPLQGFVQFTQRVLPYVTWARSPRNRDTRIQITKDNVDVPVGPSAGYYVSIYEQLANLLSGAFTDQTRFTDAEKAQLFIGYLASFPQSKKPSSRQEESEKIDNRKEINHEK